MENEKYLVIKFDHKIMEILKDNKINFKIIEIEDLSELYQET